MESNEKEMSVLEIGMREAGYIEIDGILQLPAKE